jgi:Bacteriophage minor capsid protein
MIDIGNAIAVALVARLGVGYTHGTNVFDGPVRAADALVPQEAIFVLPTGGFDSIPERTTAAHLVNPAIPPTELVSPTIQVRIRSACDDYTGGYAIARAVRSALHRYIPSGFLECRVREAHPIYLGRDSLGCHEWSFNLECMLDAQT